MLFIRTTEGGELAVGGMPRILTVLAHMLPRALPQFTDGDTEAHRELTNTRYSS